MAREMDYVDEVEEQEQTDGLGTGLILVTTLVLLAAIILVQLAMKGSRCDSMVGAAPSAEPLGAAADDPAGAAVLPGAALDDSGEDVDGDEGGVAPPPQAKSTAKGRTRLTRRIVAPPYHACAAPSSRRAVTEDHHRRPKDHEPRPR